MSYLISVAIGPVQEFIAAARRSRDLWYGSHLLSEVSKAVALALQQAGATLIFPSTGKLLRNIADDLHPGSALTVANKILAISSNEPGKLCENARDAAVRLLTTTVRDNCLAQIRNKVGANRDLMDKQLASMLEFYAAWVPYTDSHSARRREVESLLASRKTLRAFAPHWGVAGLPKSSLDGFRETVVIDGTRSAKLFESHLKGNEQLDAIGLIKRFARPFGEASMPDFDSTLDIAAIPYTIRIEASKSFDDYRVFIKNNVPYKTRALLYEHESRQLFDEGEENLSEGNRAKINELKSTRERIYKEHGRPNPPYYALFVGDGDSMGRAISELPSCEAHQTFSRLLSEFAQRAKTIIELQSGCPIYTGGDDVIALLPLHSLLKCVRQLHEEFVTSLGDYNVSFSAGITIAHALEPLSEVLRLARQAESRAKKNVLGKNAVAFTVCPRSGANVDIEGKWFSSQSEQGLVSLLDEIVEHYQNGDLSLGFAHELRELELRTPSELDTVLHDLAIHAAGRKKENFAAKQLILKCVPQDGMSRKRLCLLYRTMLVARPIFKAIREADK